LNASLFGHYRNVQISRVVLKELQQTCGVIKTVTEFCELIDRWDELDDGVKAEIAELVKHW